MKRIPHITAGGNLNLSALDYLIGKSCSEINSELCLEVNLFSKSFARSIIEKSLLKYNISIDSKLYQYKMIRVDELGRAKNPSPLKITDYNKIITEDWENSDFKCLLSHKFIFFMITHGSPDKSIFKGYRIHEFNNAELECAKQVWLDTRNKIVCGEYDAFLTDRETSTFFFKTHSPCIDARVETPNSTIQPPRSFWISKTLLTHIII